MKFVKFFEKDNHSYKIMAKSVSPMNGVVRVTIHRIDFLFFNTELFSCKYENEFVEEAIQKAYNSYFNMEKNIANFRNKIGNRL